ncbi:MAG: SpaH/EbpB family LPXTG-anchored major pilin [Actinomycetaceae bacterium]|nr:SpaH/EbpB family LPXTG-anchored major pilin [Actinomycetaceae bacterium]
MGTRTLSVKFSHALALLLAALLALVALPAFAESPAPLGPGNINPATKGSITVHKMAEPSTGKAGDSHEIGDAPQGPTGAKLKGVRFSIKKVEGIDLATAAGWDKLAKVTAKMNAAVDAKTASEAVQAEGLNLVAAEGNGNTEEKVTTIEGKVEFTDLPIGVYMVIEGDDTGNNGITSKAAPFLVTVPFPSKTEASGWNYAVHVYPKNSVSLVEKIVADGTAQKLGDKLKWYVSFSIPAETETTSFKFEDKLDVDTDFVALKAAIVDSTVAKDKFAEEFAKGTSVNLPVVANDNGSPATVSVALDKTSAEGTQALLDLNANKGKKLVFELEVTVARFSDGAVSNGSDGEPWAKGTFNNSNTPLSPTTPPTASAWGKVTLEVLGDGQDSKKLSGAKFTVYGSKEDAEAGTNPIFTPDLVTGADGTTDITLRTGTYYLVQNEAPAGYNKLPEPIRFDMNGKNDITYYDQLVGGLGTPVKDANWKITNKQRTPGNSLTDLIPGLPNTGAAGRLLLGLAGTAVLFVAAGTFMVSVRRKNQA